MPMSEADATTTEGRATLRIAELTPILAIEVESGPSSRSAEALARRFMRADEGCLRADLARARSRGDAAGERVACVELARFLVLRDLSLAEAAGLAERALAVTDETELRNDAATWFEGVGLHPEAARLLLGATCATADTLHRAAVAFIRAGDAEAARAALERAAALDASDPASLELLASLSTWAPAVVTASAACAAYLGAGSYRRMSGLFDAEFENKRRALEIDPSSVTAGFELAGTWAERLRPGAVAGVRRALAVALDPAALRALHALVVSASNQDVSAAIASALDGSLDASLGEDDVTDFDDLLGRAGLAALAAARAQLRALDASAELAVEAWVLAGDDASGESARRWAVASRSGDEAARARAIERFSAYAEPAMRGVLLAVAADIWAGLGDRDRAKLNATLAARLAPQSMRAAASVRVAFATSRDLTEVLTMERGAQHGGLTGAECTALSAALAGVGEHHSALAWAERGVALRPGDPVALCTLLARAVTSGDATRLCDAICWSTSQPCPAAAITGALAISLAALADIDLSRAVVAARRILDTFGCADEPLAFAVLAAAHRAGDRGLQAIVHQRSVDAARTHDERSHALHEIARLRRDLGDHDGELRALRASRDAGEPIASIEGRVASLAGRAQSGDAELAWLTLHAECLEMHTLGVPRPGAGRGPRAGRFDTDSVGCAALANALRQVGAALWDCTGDRAAAVAVWIRAAALSGEGDFVQLAHDVERFAPEGQALETLLQLSAATRDGGAAAALHARAAGLALTSGAHTQAFKLASQSLLGDPAATSALGVAESATLKTRDFEPMSRVYDQLSDTALGRFGRRAIHFRGARFFEQNGVHALALWHAAAAFVAVPSEGAPLVILRRTSTSAGDHATAVDAIEAVADRATSISARTAWLVRAADATGGGNDGLQRRFELLLKAAVAARLPKVIALFGQATRELLAAVPEQREAIHARVREASASITHKLEGPEGARLGLDFAQLSIDAFGDASGALGAIDGALGADADLEEYSTLLDLAGALARSENAPTSISRLAAMVAKPYANVGAPALKLFAAIATARGDVAMATTFVLLAAERDGDDTALVRQADTLARGIGDVPAARRFFKAVKQPQRLAAWTAALESARDAADLAATIAALQPTLELSEQDARPALEEELRAARASLLEQAPGERVTGPVSADEWAALATTRSAAGEHGAAVSALQNAARIDPSSVERWTALERAATLANDHQCAALSLGEIELRADREMLPDVLKRLASARAMAGDLSAAIATWTRALALAPDDETADRALETLYTEGRAFAELAAHLARRAERLAGQPEMRDTLRLVRLRRAAILEQRLGLIELACEEVDRIALEWPNNESVLRYLADLCERADRPARAVSCYRRLAGAAVSDGAKADLLLRAARAARAARDVVNAYALAQSATLVPSTRRHAYELIAEIARERHDDRNLARALSFLAAAEPVEPEQASARLLEASQAAVRAGDGVAALTHARRAAKFTPSRSDVQLFARGLEYRLRGAGTATEASATRADLAKVTGDLDRDDAALNQFLVAEAIGVLDGAEAQWLALTEASRTLGVHALLQAALGDHFTRSHLWAEAREAYDLAMEGPLLGMRSRASVAQSAAEVAVVQGELELALSLFEVAAEDVTLREHARRRIAEVCVRTGDVERAEALLDELERSTGSAAVTAPLATGQGSVAGMTSRLEVSAPDSVEGWLTLSRKARECGDTEAAARLFASCDERARVAVGDDLASLVAGDPNLAVTLLAVRQRQVDTRPADTRLLTELCVAARAAGAPGRAAAVAQILAAFDPSLIAPAAPPLAAQVARADCLAMLVRPGLDPLCDAIALVWEAAKPAFSRMLMNHSSADFELVVAAGAGVLPNVYRQARRVLGVDVILFSSRGLTGLPESAHLRDDGCPVHGLPLLAQVPSALIAGDCSVDDASLRFAVGYAMLAALPRTALVLGAREADARVAWNSLLAAFGPGDMRRTLEETDTRMVEALWNAVPSRAQRRLRDSLADEVGSFGVVRERARQLARRGGLMLSGDFAETLRRLSVEVDLTGEGGTLKDLEALCAAEPAAFDLVRLASSEAYAAARFHGNVEGGV